LSGVQRVRDFIATRGIEAELRELDKSTRTSTLAAEALGCTVAEIAKSVVFIGRSVYVVVTSGDMKVNEGRLSKNVGEPVELASPGTVIEKTGYPVGGVPPFPHMDGVSVLPDVSVSRFERVWAAAGAPNAVFRIRTSELFKVLGTGPVDVSESVAQRI
jgi:prolyl-tRNA editing enzyme YbaK/EbsC (Cys-tRNA(Pro) deacylase)